MTSAHWYANPAAREARVEPGHSALAFHKTLEDYAPTPLLELPELAQELGVARVFLKDESNRLGLPAFKILGASWAICRALCERLGLDLSTMTIARLRLHLAEVDADVRPALVTATDGNHGRAVARVASLLGLTARVYVPAGLTDAAIAAIVSEGAQMVALDCTYDQAVVEASRAAEKSETDILIQDTAWDDYTDVPTWIVDGYATLFVELDEALVEAGVTHADLVACPVGVGSLAQAMVQHYRSRDSRDTSLLSVEPETAACIAESLIAGEPVSVDTAFPSIMSGLNCGTPSTLAWPTLSAGLDGAVSVSEEDCRRAVVDLTALKQTAGPCGAATLAGVRNVLANSRRRQQLGIGTQAVLVLLITEGLSANPMR